MGNNGKQIHTNTLNPSDLGHRQMLVEMEERFLTVCNRYIKKWGIELVIPESLRPDFVRWRQMVSRHNKGDYRHTEAEWESIKSIAQWTVDENCKICDQPPVTVEWGG